VAAHLVFFNNQKETDVNWCEFSKIPIFPHKRIHTISHHKNIQQMYLITSLKSVIFCCFL
jgi:hypothetical protein